MAVVLYSNFIFGVISDISIYNEAFRRKINDEFQCSDLNLEHPMFSSLPQHKFKTEESVFVSFSDNSKQGSTWCDGLFVSIWI